ncbi:glycosyl transferase [Candidatus Levyibacteriota bacterium]|nr:glycosyltransferase family 2 protein [Candidatus Levybacteria bacterium]GDX61795.1 glycosyl transferase [Candidatus Levybacteria bacterium]
MNHISLITINFNSHSHTIKLLQSIEEIEKKDMKFSVIIVDNASVKKSVDIIREYINKQQKGKSYDLILLENKENIGFSGGNNKGILYALHKLQSTHVLLINNDTILDKKILIELLNCSEASSIGIVTSKIYFAKGHEFYKNRYNNKELGNILWYAGGIIDWKNMVGMHRGVDEVDNQQYDKVEDTDFASGCCILIKKEILEKVGMLDERFFLYYEDSDYSIRVKKSGYRVIYCPKAIMWHNNAGSTGGSGSNLQDYYITRNRLLFGMQYAPLRTKVALLKEAIKLLFSGRQWQKKGILDFFRGEFFKGSFKSFPEIIK